MQLFQQGQPAIERLASGSKRRIKKDLARPNLRTSPYVVADLFERTGEDRAVLAEWLISQPHACVNDHRDCGWIAPCLLRHLLDAAEHLCHDGNWEEYRIPSVGQSREALECSRDECAQVDRRMRLLDRLQVDVRLGHIKKLAPKLDWIRGPNRFQQG